MLCSGCNYEASKIDGMVALDKFWHKSCFKCGVTGREGCGKVLIPSPNQYTIYQNIPYCNSCYNFTFKEIVQKDAGIIPELSKQNSFSQSSNKIRSGGSMGLVAMLQSKASSVSGNNGKSIFSGESDISLENFSASNASTLPLPIAPLGEPIQDLTSVNSDKNLLEKNASIVPISNIPYDTQHTTTSTFSNNETPVVEKFTHLNLNKAIPVPLAPLNASRFLPSNLLKKSMSTPIKQVNIQDNNTKEIQHNVYTTTPLKPVNVSQPLLTPPIPPTNNLKQESNIKEINTTTNHPPLSNKSNSVEVAVTSDKHPSLHFIGDGDEVDESEW